MRKFYWCFLLILLSFPTFSQIKLGLKFSPVIASSRIEFDSDSLDVENDGAALRFALGLSVDKQLTETYFLSSGLFIVPKRVGITVRPDAGGNGISEEYYLQYLQIPITLKLFTNEIKPDLSIYFQVGGALEFKVNDRPADEDFDLFDEAFKPIDGNAMIGAGAEYRAGINTILYVGFTYQRGLFNSINETDVDYTNLNAPGSLDGLIIRNNVFMIDLGVKF